MESESYAWASRLETPSKLGRFGFVISPRSPPCIPDVLLCSVDTRSPLVSLVGALDSDVTPVSARNLSRWLFLLARQAACARPIRPPFVYRPITVVDRHKKIPCDSPDQLPPGCYALFDLEGNPYPYPVGRTMPRPTFAETESAWDVPDDDSRAADRMLKPIPEFLAIQARKRDGGLCCLTGRPSNCITWVIPPLLCRAVNTPTFSREQCLSLENVFTISMDTASSSSKIFQRSNCWITLARRRRLAASGTPACVGRWLYASLVVMLTSMVSAQSRLGSFSMSSPGTGTT
ncbi:hypothetical protein FB451DRAFT_1320376 [Mycena latifolia]|nr:hypothetical protein FB451DRAFT_1320376 [Mycena latifolia]